MGMKKPQWFLPDRARLLKCPCAKEFSLRDTRIFSELRVGKINGGKWVGAAAERRRFFQATRRKNFLSVAKKKPYRRRGENKDSAAPQELAVVITSGGDAPAV